MARKVQDSGKVTEASIDELTPDPANVRRHGERNVRATDASLKRFGAARSIVVDEKGVVRAGNRTLESAKAAGITKTIVIDANPDELVVVRRKDWSPSEATAYSIADNRTAELAEWDDLGLAEQLQALQSEDFALEAVGYDGDELDAMIASLGGIQSEEPVADPGPQIDKADELQKKWGTERGQLWVIPSLETPGRSYRLLCGDSTKAEDVARLMEEEKALLMNTDPPYGVAYDHQTSHDAKNDAYDQDKTYRTFDKIAGDELTGETLQAFLESAIRVAVPHLTPNAAFYLWHPMLTQGTFFAAAAAAADILIHRQIIWVKPHFIFGRGDYHWRHELCFYGWVRGNRPEFYGERNQDTVWVLEEGGGSIRRDQNHPTQKPVELFTRPILNHTRPGELVYEPFTGSGSQFVAAEQTGRLCYGLEIEPKYVAVTLERLAGMGLSPKLESAPTPALSTES